MPGGGRAALLALAVLLLGSIVLGGVLGHGDWTGVRKLLAFYAVCVLLVPLHELGHAAFGRAVGLKVARVVVGKGKLLLRRRFWGVTWQLNAVPFGGLTMAVPFAGTRFVRARHWFFALGGPAVDAAVALLAWGLAARLRAKGHTGSLWLLDTTATAATLGVIFNLLPLRHNVDGVALPSDGRQLLTIPFLKADRIEDLFVAYYLVSGREEGLAGNHAAALDWFEQGLARYPHKPVLRLLMATALFRLGRIKETKVELAVALAGTLDANLRPLALNDWAWYAFLDRDEADRSCAERRSTEALGLAPGSAAVAGTRGAVLLWNGHVAPAIPLLKQNLAAPGATPSSCASNAALLAIAHAARGDDASARAALERARRADAESILYAEAASLVAALLGGARAIRAARGGRAIFVHDGALELVDGTSRAGRRVPLAEIARVDIGLTARGHARLSLALTASNATVDRHWHLPVEPRALWPARLALHEWFANQAAATPTPVPRSVVQAAATADAHRLGQLAAGAALLTSFLGLGKGGLTTPNVATVIAMLSSVALFGPGPAPLLALGSVTALGILAVAVGDHTAAFARAVATESASASLFTATGNFWLLLQGAAGLLAFIAGYSALRGRPDARKQGLRITVGTLLLASLSPSALLGLTRDSSVAGVAAAAAAHAPAGVAAASLAVVLILVLPRWRIAGYALAAFGVAWLFLGSTAFQDRFVLAGLGPREAPLAWTVQPATVLHETKLPCCSSWTSTATVSPHGQAYAARFFATRAEASAYDDQEEDDATETRRDGEGAAEGGSDAGTAAAAVPAQPRPRWLVSDFNGHQSTVEARHLRFIDDRRLLIVAGSKVAPALRELAVESGAATDVGTTRLPASLGLAPELFAGAPGGAVDVVTADRARPFQDWVWSPSGALTLRGIFAPLDVRDRLVDVVDDPGRPAHILIERMPPPVAVYSGTHLRSLVPSSSRPELILRGPDGDRPLRAATALECAGQRRNGELVCVTQDAEPTVLLAIDGATGAIRRLATVPTGHGPANLLDDGRIALSIGRDLAVIDPDAHRAWRLHLPDRGPGTYAHLASSGLAVVINKQDRDPQAPPPSATLLILATPR